MKTNYLNFQGRELPTYLGYGILDRSSIVVNDHGLQANYLFESDGSLVHQVLWKEECILNTWCHGKHIAETFASDLKHALLLEARNWKLHESECFQFIAEQVHGLGNVCINIPEPDNKVVPISYYPAGKLFMFSLPLQQLSENYVAFRKSVQESPQFSFLRERKGTVIYLDDNLEFNIKPLIIADFIVPLAQIYGAAEIILNCGLLEETRFPLIINESIAGEKTVLQAFIGDQQHPYTAICFKEFENEKQIGLIDLFYEKVDSYAK